MPQMRLDKVRESSGSRFFFLRPLAQNLIRVQNIVHCVGCHPTSKIARQSRAIFYSHAPFARKIFFLDIFLQENLRISKIIYTFAA